MTKERKHLKTQVFQRAFVGELESRLQQSLNFLQIVLGPRQIGKTTGIQQILDRWDGPKLYASADETLPPGPEWIEEQWKLARTMGTGTLLVLDEIQKVRRWSEVVKKLFDKDRPTRNLKIVLLGSASLWLQAGLSESLAGRFELIEVPHWDAYECEAVFGWNLEQYLAFGGYPAATELIDDEIRWQSFIRNSIIEPLIARDILSLRQIGNIALFRQTFDLAMHYPAQELSYQKMLGQLQDKGNAKTIKTYLEILEGAYVLRILEKYSSKRVLSKSSSPKLVPLAPALVHAFSSPSQVTSDTAWYGRVFESALAAKILQTPGQLYYWRNGKYEVDFVWEHNKKVLALEVKSSRARSLDSLQRFASQFPDARTMVINRSLGAKFLASKKPLEMLLQLYDAAG